MRLLQSERYMAGLLAVALFLTACAPSPPAAQPTQTPAAAAKPAQPTAAATQAVAGAQATPGAAAKPTAAQPQAPAPTASPAAAQAGVWTSPEQLARHVPGPDLRITLVVGTTEHSFYNTMRLGALDAARDFNVSVDVQGAKNFGPVDQTPVLNAAIASKPDAMIIVPTSPVALDETIRNAARSGIVVFMNDIDVNNKALRVTQIETDHALAAEWGAKTMARAVGERGEIGIISSEPGTSTEAIRIGGFVKGVETFPNMQALDPQYCGMDIARCTNATAALIGSHPNMTGVFAPGEPTGIGAGTGVRNAGKAGVVRVGSFDASPAQQAQLRDGSFDFLIVQKPYQEGYESVRIASEYLRGAETSQSPLLPPGTRLSALPANIKSGYAIAVSDIAYCPPDLPSDVQCGLIDDPDISQWLYQG